MNITQFKALSFDCYGTLVDWEKGIVTALRPWIQSNQIDLSDEEILQVFARYETSVQIENPKWKYTQVLEEVAVRIGQELNIEAGEDIRNHLGKSVGDWPAFEDTRAALKILNDHFKLIIISNIDEESFQATNNKQLNTEFFRILTAEKIGSYKPNLRNFEYLITHLGEQGIQKNEILHVAQSLYHDIEPASEIGLSTVWINRRANNPGFGATPQPTKPVKADMEFSTMEAFAGFVEGEFK